MMKNLNCFLLSVVLLGIFSIFFPQICLADIAMGFFIYNPMILVFVLFIGIWTIEAITVKEMLGGSGPKILLVVLAVNLLTTLLGFLIAVSGFPYLISNLESTTPLIFILIIPLFLSAVIEGIFLLSFFKKRGWKAVFRTSLSMNIKSYFFVTVFLFLDVLEYLAVIVVIVLIPWSLIKILDLSLDQKPMLKNKKNFYKIIILVISFFLVVITVYAALNSSHGKERISSGREKDIRQISIALESFRSEYGQYPQSKDIPQVLEKYLSSIPQDPGGGPCNSYQWIPNLDNPDKYCIFACLENGKFFAANEKGKKTIDFAPLDLYCWEDKTSVEFTEVFEKCQKASSLENFLTEIKAKERMEALYGENVPEIEPIKLPIETVFSEAKIYVIPVGIAGGDVLTQTFFNIDDNYCLFTDKNAQALFSPIEKEEVLKYLEFRFFTLSSSAYGRHRFTILEEGEYDERYCNGEVSEKKVTTISEEKDGFLVNWIWYTQTAWAGYYSQTVTVKKNGEVEFLTKGNEPFIDCGPGIMF